MSDATPTKGNVAAGGTGTAEKKPSRPRPVHETWWRRKSTWRWRGRTTLIVAAAAVLGLGTYLAPAIVLAFLPKYADILLRKEIGHRLAVGKLDLDVWRLHLTAHDIMLAPEDGGPPVATSEVADVEIDPWKLIHGIYITSLELQGVRAKLTRREDGTIDFFENMKRARDRQKKKDAGKKKKSGNDVHIHLTTARFSHVALTYADEKMHLERHFDVIAQALGLGTISSGDAEDEQPGRFLVVARSRELAKRVELLGETQLAGPKPWTKMLVTVEGLDLAGAAELIPNAHAVARKASVSADLHIETRSVPSGRSWTILDVGPAFVHVDGVSRASLERLQTLIESAPDEDSFVSDLRVTRPEVEISRARDGRLDLCGLVIEAPPGPPPPPAAAGESIAATSSSAIDYLLAHLQRSLDGLEESRPEALPPVAANARGAPRFPKIPLGKVRVDGGVVRFRDRATRGEPEIHVEDLSVVLDIDRTGGPRPATGHVHLAIPGFARSVDLELAGTVRPRSVNAWTALAVEGIDGRGLAPYLDPAGQELRVRDGALHGRATLRIAREPEGRLSGEVAVADLRFEDGGHELARLGTLGTGFLVRTTFHGTQVALDRLVVEDAQLGAVRTRAGEVVVSGFVASRPRVTPAPPPAPTVPREPKLVLSAPLVTISNVAVSLEDESGRIPVRTSLSLEALRLENLSVGAPTTAKLLARLSAPGLVDSLVIEGRAFTSVVTPGFVACVHARGLSSSVARGYLEPRGWDVNLEGHTFDARVAAALAPAADGGRALVGHVDHLALADAKGTGLSVESLSVRASRLDPSSGITQVPLVEVKGPFVAIHQDARGTTIARALTKLATTTPEEGPAEPQPLPPAPQRLRSTFVLDSARLDEGAVELVEKDGRVTRVEGIRLRAGPVDLGPAADRRPLDLTLRAAIPHVAHEILVAGVVAQPYEAPRIRLHLRALGVDLDAVRARVPGAFDRALVHAGSLHAELDARLRFLRGGSFTGEVSVRDVALRDDIGRSLLGAAEVRARVVRIDPAANEYDLASIDVDRPRIEISRMATGEIVVGGLATKEKVLALSDEERRDRAAHEGESSEERKARKNGGKRKDGAPGTTTKPASAPREGPPARSPKITVGRVSLASGSAGFTDYAALDDARDPFRLAVRQFDLNIDHFALTEASEVPTVSYLLEVGLDDGGKLSCEGSAAKGPGGVSGWLALDVRDIGLRRFSRYSENASDVRLEGGTVTVSAGADLQRERVSGLAEVVIHELRARRTTGDPAARAASFVGVEGAVTVLTDASGDTTIRVPFEGRVSNPRIGTGNIVAQVFRTAVVDAFQQPLKLVFLPIKQATGESPIQWIQDKVTGKPEPLERPATSDALFAPGDSRLTVEGARAIEQAVEISRNTRRLVSLRASCGRADQTRALRQGELSGDDARSLIARLGAERRALEAEHRDVAAGERYALESGDGAQAAQARARLRAIGEQLARIDRATDDLANRAEAGDPELARSRAEDALRRLADERTAVIRRALVAAGVENDRIRVRLPHLSDDGREGRVTIEVAP